MESETISKNGARRQRIWTFFAAALLFSCLSICSYGQTLFSKIGSNGKLGFVDNMGFVVIPYQYDEVRNDHNTPAFSTTGVNKYIAIVKKGKKWGVIDLTGYTVVPIRHNNFFRAKYRIIGATPRYTNLVNKRYAQGKYNSFFAQIEERKVAQKAEQAKAKEQREALYKDISDRLKQKYDYVFLRDNDFSVRQNGKYGSCDLSGKEIVPCKYDYVSYDKNYVGFYRVQINEKYGACDLSGKEVIPCEYDFVLKKDNKYEVKIYGKYFDYPPTAEQLRVARAESIKTTTTSSRTTTNSNTTQTTTTSSNTSSSTTIAKTEEVKKDNSHENNVCSGCGGVGTINCGACFGLGQTYNFFRSSYETCNFCQGSGKFYCFCQTGGVIGITVRAGYSPKNTGGTEGTVTGSTKIQCTRCNGTGKCNVCNGTGKGMTCGYCSSSGRPGQVFKSGIYGGAPYWQICPQCYGKGYNDCNTCRGIGKCIQCKGLGWY